MTNEEKIRQIVAMSDTKYVYDIVDFEKLETALHEDLMEMAKWKDFKFKYAIKDYIANCKKVGDNESAAALEDFYKQFKTE